MTGILYYGSYPLLVIHTEVNMSAPTASTSAVADRLEIDALISTLGRCLDEGNFEALRDIYTEDAGVSTPGGTSTGIDALVDQARRRHSADAGIQNVRTNLLIEIDGDRAWVRDNVLAAFAHDGVDDPAPFLAGGVERFELRRTTDGWRITNLLNTPTWALNRPANLQL
jgi:hypothetical protein